LFTSLPTKKSFPTEVSMEANYTQYNSSEISDSPSEIPVTVSVPPIVAKRSSGFAAFMWLSIGLVIVVIVLYASNKRFARFVRKFAFKPCKRCLTGGKSKRNKKSKKKSGIIGSGGITRRSNEHVELDYTRTNNQEERDEFEDDLESEQSVEPMIGKQDTLSSPDDLEQVRFLLGEGFG
jgi:hypothetical protein